MNKKAKREAVRLVERPYVPYYELIKKLDTANKGVAALSARLYQDDKANRILSAEVDRLAIELAKLQKVLRELLGREP